MISIVQPLQSGNALRLFLTPPAGATRWRVFRAGSDSFSGPEPDDYSFVAYEGDDKVFVDAASLQNEVMAFYKPFYRIGGQWVAGPTASGTPAATYEDLSTDALTVLRERLELALQVEVQRGALGSELGYVQVFTAPPSLEQNVRFPLVTLSLDGEIPAERGIGDALFGDLHDEDTGLWTETEGWLAGVTISIVGWSQNSDERIELRKAIRRAIVANLPVFEGLGLQQVNLSMNDMDAVSGEFGAVNIYQVLGSFTCTAPVRVGYRVDPIKSVEVRSTNG